MAQTEKIDLSEFEILEKDIDRECVSIRPQHGTINQHASKRIGLNHHDRMVFATKSEKLHIAKVVSDKVKGYKVWGDKFNPAILSFHSQTLERKLLRRSYELVYGIYELGGSVKAGEMEWFELNLIERKEYKPVIRKSDRKLEQPFRLKF